MNKKLSKYQINFILLQLVAFTFVCIISFVDFFISYEFIFIKIGIQSFTVLTVIIYEIIVYVIYRRAKKNHEDDDEEDVSHNEKYLWFEILLLLDILIIVALVSQYTSDYLNISIPLVIGFFLYYFISIIVKPYFGIKNKK